MFCKIHFVFNGEGHCVCIIFSFVELHMQNLPRTKTKAINNFRFLYQLEDGNILVLSLCWCCCCHCCGCCCVRVLLLLLLLLLLGFFSVCSPLSYVTVHSPTFSKFQKSHSYNTEGLFVCLLKAQGHLRAYQYRKINVPVYRKCK